MSSQRVLLHLERDLRRAVVAADVYYLEAIGDDTLVRLRSRRRIRDLRPLGEMMSALKLHGFVRVHRDFAVNLAHVREVRGRRDARGWEVRLNPPVHRVLPVSRGQEKALWAAFGE